MNQQINIFQFEDAVSDELRKEFLKYFYMDSNLLKLFSYESKAKSPINVKLNDALSVVNMEGDRLNRKKSNGEYYTRKNDGANRQTFDALSKSLTNFYNATGAGKGESNKKFAATLLQLMNNATSFQRFTNMAKAMTKIADKAAADGEKYVDNLFNIVFYSNILK